MVAYVHIEYSTYQFSEESKGGGGRKKRGPERVKKVSDTDSVEFYETGSGFK